jgi:hypothetical protein
VRGQRLDQRKIDSIFYALGQRHALDPREPHALAVAQLVKLARLGAQDSAEMLGSVTAQSGGLRFESIDEKATAHRRILRGKDKHNYR